mgnify:CR=1 FL=1
MANKTEFSRIVTKGTTISGITPTINTATTIDATWIDSDILNREMFINVEDKKVFIRANDDILEFNTFGTGSTPADLYLPLTGGTVSGNINMISGATITGLDYLPLSGGVMDSGAQISGATGNYLDLDFNFGPITNGISLGDIIGTGTGLILGSGSTVLGNGGNNIAIPSTLGIQLSTTSTGEDILLASGNDIFLDSNGYINIQNAPTTDNTNTKVLSRDTVTGNIEEIDVSSIGDGSFLPLSGGVLTGGVSGATGNYLDLDFNFGPFTNGIILSDSPLSPTSNGLFMFPTTGVALGNSDTNSISLALGDGIKVQTVVDDIKLEAVNGYVELISDNGITIRDVDNSHQGSFIHIPTPTYAIGTTSTTKGKTIISSEGAVVNAGVYNTVILGGTGIIASESNSVYVPKLNIGITSGTSISYLGIDSNGFVVTGSTVVNKYAATVTLNAGNNTITHNLNDTDVIVAIKTSAGVVQIPNSVDSFAANTVNINVSSTLTNARVIIIK